MGCTGEENREVKDLFRLPTMRDLVVRTNHDTKI